MLAFLDKNIVFFATPKTGTTAIEQQIGIDADIIFQKKPGVKHISVRKYNRLIAPYVNKNAAGAMQSIAVMREPHDWLASWYRYRQRSELRGHPNSTAKVDFSTFVEAYLSDERPDYANLGSQKRFFSTHEGQIGIDILYRYTELNELAEYFSQLLNRDVVFKQLNVSPKADLRLSPTVKRMYERAYAGDFELYESINPSTYPNRQFPNPKQTKLSG